MTISDAKWGNGRNWLVCEITDPRTGVRGLYVAFSFGRAQFRLWRRGPQGKRLQFWLRPK